MSHTDALRKTTILDEQMRDRFGIGLADWITHKRGQEKSWRDISEELRVALGYQQRPLSYEGLRVWWEENR